ncbi:MAG: RING finger protein [Angelakisella sp.]
MPNYTGNECPACGKVFSEGDDIVVCPVCGSPHHRECYKAMGHCGNEDFHKEDKKWEADPSVVQDEEPQDTIACRQCGHPNPAGNIFCQTCGQRMGAAPAQSPAGQTGPFASFADFMGANLDYNQQLCEGVTVKEACDYVGPNHITFIMRFKALLGRGSISFNWCAFFFSFFYCFYRKMYKMGAILLGIFALTVIPTGYFSAVAIGDILAANGTLGFPIEFITEGNGYQGLLVVSAISRMVSFVTTLFVGFFFNKFYFAKMVKNIHHVKERGHFSTGSQEYSYALYAAGGTNKGAVMMLLSAIIFAYIAYGYIASFLLLR